VNNIKTGKKKILLHACCAPCTAGVYNQLKNDFDVRLFWYNPNIFPKAEHDRRLTELLNFCDKLGIKIIIGDYFWQEEHKYWLKKTKGLENEPERGLPAKPGYAWQAGRRCKICYRMRLEATAAVAQQINNHHSNSFEHFGAELSVSPHKDAEMINKIGERVGKKFGLAFYSADFKKGGGAQIASKISRKYNLYRQSYCGCEFSRR